MRIIGFINLKPFTSNRSDEDLEIVHGDILGLSDTKSFLKSLAGLDSINGSIKNTEKRQMRERKAAAGLFNWEVLILLHPHTPPPAFLCHEMCDAQNLVFRGSLSTSNCNTSKICFILVQHFIVVDCDG